MRVWQDVKRFFGIPVCILIWYLLVKRIKGAFCPFVILFGLPCPGCGLTRAALYLFRGSLKEAFYMNPAIYLWALYLLYIIVVRYVLGKPLKHALFFAAVISILMIIRYFWGMYLYYPNRPPFAYTGGNIMEDIIPGYMDLVRNFKLPF